MSRWRHLLPYWWTSLPPITGEEQERVDVRSAERGIDDVDHHVQVGDAPDPLGAIPVSVPLDRVMLSLEAGDVQTLPKLGGCCSKSAYARAMPIRPYYRALSRQASGSGS